MPYETITKLQAAERQLGVAIRLFFDDRDLVAVHTLAAAAQEVLHDLGRSRGVTSIFKDNPLIRPDKKAEMARLFSEAQNFFKHADRDPGAQLRFYDEATKFYLLDAALMYIELTGQQFPEITILQVWFVAKFPDLFVEGLRVKGLSKEQIADRVRKIDPDDHRIFLDMIDHPPC